MGSWTVTRNTLDENETAGNTVPREMVRDSPVVEGTLNLDFVKQSGHTWKDMSSAQ